MGWADWMVINQSLEEELELEKNVRDVQSCDDGDALLSRADSDTGVRSGAHGDVLNGCGRGARSGKAEQKCPSRAESLTRTR
jgi:hypothetical protein